jgi:chromosome partitioning protein
MAKVIGVCNQKGGTGKTTTAVNICSYMALASKKTLLVDIDPQGNATSGCGVDSKDKNSIYDVLMGQARIQDSIYPSPYPNLSVIPSDISLTGGEIELVNLNGRELRLKQEINKIRQEFDYIILDAPPSLGLLTVNVLAAADSLVVPIQCEYYALEGVSKLVHTVDLIRERLNPNLEIEGILLTMADFRTRLTLQVIEEVKRFFKDKTFNTIIPRNTRLAEAPSFGKPIPIYDNRCVGAKAYQSLTEEILKEKIQVSDKQGDVPEMSTKIPMEVTE